MSLSKMKMIPRSGWLSHDVSVQDVESVADHTFSTCALSMLLADLEVKRGVKVNVENVLRMAVLHDLAESLTFDISKAYLEYMGKKGSVMKREIERTAWKHIARGIEEPDLAREYSTVQNQYIVCKTTEAKIVHAADSLDILLQVANYERRGYPHATVSDLWNESVKMIKQSDVQSAHRMLESMIRQNRNLSLRRRIK